MSSALLVSDHDRLVSDAKETTNDDNTVFSAEPKVLNTDECSEIGGCTLSRLHYNEECAEDTVQLAKISKLLLELEAGNISKYRGKSLDEIHIDENEVISEDKAVEENDVPLEFEPRQEQEPLQEQAEPQQRQEVQVPDKLHRQSKSKRTKLSHLEKSAVERHLGKFLRTCVLPGKHQCEETKHK